MIELRDDQLVFRLPAVHDDAVLRVGFQRTLRIPDDDRDYALPPGLGGFPLRHVDDFAARLPKTWLTRGGVMLPMYQSEALWINFRADGGFFGSGYPFALKIAAGKINAVTGDGWSPEFEAKPQDYVVVPTQPWLDGFCVEHGVIRQFVAMPLGRGYSAEEQIKGTAEHGGIQILACPMKREVHERLRKETERMTSTRCFVAEDTCSLGADMGLAPGGRMRQEIYDDPYGLDAWDFDHSSRCFVHLANSEAWRAITGDPPPTRPITAQQYTDAGLPWFEYYAEGERAVDGSETLANLKSVAALGKQEGKPVPDNAPVAPTTIVHLRKGLKPGQVREGRF